MLPCAVCRSGRRKCVWINDRKKCERCERLRKTCLPALLQTEEQQVEFMKNQIQQLNDAYQQLVEHRSELSKSMTAYNHSSRALCNLVRDWKFKIKDGHFVIETDIKTVQDLVSFGSSIPYLSPWSADWGLCLETADISASGHSGLLFKFKSESKSNWTPFMIKLFTRPLSITSLSEPSQTRLLRFVANCIDVFFSCHYFFRILVHESSFRSRLSSLQNPLLDLTVLCICCYVCATPCRHMTYNLTELRHMADACYKKAKSILLDQFDVPEKRIENVISICLLAHYLHVTLRFSESRRLLDLAYQICLDLEEDSSPLFSQHSTDASFLSKNEDPEATEDIDQALLVRAIYLIIYFRRLVNFFSSESSYYEPRLRLPRWKYLLDETDEARRLIRSQNWIISIFNHPFITRLWKEIHCVRIGRTCKLSFESIFKVEEVMKEWMSVIPEEFRLSEDFNNYSLCSSAIESTTDVFRILMFTDFHMIQLSIFSYLLQPSEEYVQIAQFVLHYALEKSIQSCRLLLCAIKRLFAIQKSTGACMHTLVACDVLFFVVRVVHVLTLSSEEHIAIQAKKLMKTCYQEMRHLPFIQSLCLSLEESPMADVLTFYDQNKPFNLSYYDSYTHPWFALMYDMTRFTIHQTPNLDI